MELGESDEIGADVLKHIILGLPIVAEEANEAGPDKSLFDELERGRACPRTGVGISISGGVVKGRLELDSAIGDGGGPICPLAFRGTRFEGGFSGAHSTFSYVSFRNCRFADAPPDERGRPRPSIDLSGSSVARGLDCRGIVPAGDTDHCWIRAGCVRIDGEFDLSCSRLRAPAAVDDQLLSEPFPDAIDLSLALVRGDFLFMTGTSDGRLNLRGAHVQGDVWISGARLSSASESLFLQSATIDGNLLIDGRPEKVDGADAVRRLVSHGEIDLYELKLGGSLRLTDVELWSSESGICARMIGARIGGSVEIGSEGRAKSSIGGALHLDGMEVTRDVLIAGLHLGIKSEDEGGPTALSCKSLVARQLRIRGVEPLIWNEESCGEFEPKVQILSTDFDRATLGRLKITDSRFSGFLRARSLKCTGDVLLDVRVGSGVDLEGSDIGGSLDISDLRLDPTAQGLNLKDGGIGKSLKFNRPPGPMDKMLKSLVKARTMPLRCIPDASLIETLWQYESDGTTTLVCQVAFLRKWGLVRALDGKEATIAEFAREHGLVIENAWAAEEYVRLVQAYGRDDGDQAWMVNRGDDLPPLVKEDEVAFVPSGQPPVAPQPGEAGEPLAALADSEFASRRTRDPSGAEGCYVVTGCFLHEGRLRRASFELVAATGPTINATFDRIVGPPLTGLPRYRGLYSYHPADAESESDDWVTQPALARARDERGSQLHSLQLLLLPFIQPGFSIHGTVDLTDLSCDTLDDGGGRFWGKRLQIEMDRFVYRQATWAEEDSPARARDRFRRWTQRLIAERVPLKIVDRRGWRETRLQPADFWQPWQVRRNWIYQQFDTAGLPSPSRHRVEQAEYCPQPFEQAIKVARQEGREHFAAQFEILKRRIEWDLFNRRNRLPFLGLGVAASLLWTFLRGGIHLPTFGAAASILLLVLVCTRRSERHPYLWPAVQALLALLTVGVTAAALALEDTNRVRDYFIALLMLAFLRYISAIADALMRKMFGYLRLPLNAIASLIIAFVLGWGGVHIANENHMLVMDVDPVASIVGPDNATQRLRVGFPRAAAVERNVACPETVNEALYALDILIPLIDLRQEDRCEVGRVMVPDPHERVARLESADDVVQLLRQWTIESEGLWSILKALYAIAGWFIVSLSILTFAIANRARGEAG